MEERSNKSIMDIVHEAYGKYDFYKWFYRDIDLSKATYEDLPVVNKDFFFEYEEKFNKPFHGYDSTPPECVHLETSGTTGKPLEVIVSPKGILKMYEFLRLCLKRAGAGENPCILTTESLPVLQFIHPLWKGWYSKDQVVTVPGPDAFRPGKVRATVKNRHIDIIFDATGQWIVWLYENVPEIWEENPGVIALMMMPDPGIQNRIKEYKIKQLLIIPSTDIGLIGGTCEATGTMHLSPVQDFHILTEDNKLSRTGRGLSVGNFLKEHFPFIKYSNMDIVEIKETECKCGLSDREVKVIGRKLQVKVPDLNGYYINISNVNKVLKEDIRDSFHIFHMFAAATYRDETIPKNILATFIAKTSVKEPRVVKSLSDEVLEAGAGLLYADLLKYLPVFEIPSEHVPLYDQTSRKPRIFIDITEGLPEFMKDYPDLIGYINTYTDFRVELGGEGK